MRALAAARGVHSHVLRCVAAHVRDTRAQHELRANLRAECEQDSSRLCSWRGSSVTDSERRRHGARSTSHFARPCSGEAWNQDRSRLVCVSRARAYARRRGEARGRGHLTVTSRWRRGACLRSPAGHLTSTAYEASSAVALRNDPRLGQRGRAQSRRWARNPCKHLQSV